VSTLREELRRMKNDFFSSYLATKKTEEGKEKILSVMNSYINDKKEKLKTLFDRVESRLEKNETELLIMLNDYDNSGKLKEKFLLKKLVGKEKKEFDLIKEDLRSLEIDSEENDLNIEENLERVRGELNELKNDLKEARSETESKLSNRKELQYLLKVMLEIQRNLGEHKDDHSKKEELNGLVSLLKGEIDEEKIANMLQKQEKITQFEKVVK